MEVLLYRTGGMDRYDSYTCSSDGSSAIATLDEYECESSLRRLLRRSACKALPTALKQSQCEH